MTDWSLPPTPPAQGFYGTTREKHADFDTPTHAVLGTSIERRPDAISLDYLTAFTVGPIEEGDVSQGATARVWRVRDDGEGDVLIAGALADSWGEERVLFSYDHATAPILELDVAFEQNARAVVVAERETGAGGESEVWVYWFDPVLGAFTFARLGAGRTPRALLDAPRDISQSDVLLFYATNTSDAICYRQQRDRYAVEYPVPSAGLSGLSIEDAMASEDNRVRLVCSLHDEEGGTYALVLIDSTLYPFAADPETLGAPVVALDAGELRQVVIVADMETEALFASTPSLAGLLLADPLIIYTSPDADAFAAMAPEMDGALLQDATIVVVLLPESNLSVSAPAFAGAELPQIVIVYVAFDVEALNASVAFNSALLEAA